LMAPEPSFPRAAATTAAKQRYHERLVLRSSMYRAFAAVDSGHDWAGVAIASLAAVNGAISGSNGLIRRGAVDLHGAC